MTCASCGHRAIAVDEESERLESAKAGVIAALAATAAGLPFALSSSAGQPLELASSAAIIFVTGLLFGVTYRCAASVSSPVFSIAKRGNEYTLR